MKILAAGEYVKFGDENDWIAEKKNQKQSNIPGAGSTMFQARDRFEANNRAGRHIGFPRDRIFNPVIDNHNNIF